MIRALENILEREELFRQNPNLIPHHLNEDIEKQFTPNQREIRLNLFQKLQKMRAKNILSENLISKAKKI